jgi:hypothetical protein
LKRNGKPSSERRERNECDENDGERKIVVALKKTIIENN